MEFHGRRRRRVGAQPIRLTPITFTENFSGCNCTGAATVARLSNRSMKVLLTPYRMEPQTSSRLSSSIRITRTPCWQAARLFGALTTPRALLPLAGQGSRVNWFEHQRYSDCQRQLRHRLGGPQQRQHLCHDQRYGRQSHLDSGRHQYSQESRIAATRALQLIPQIRSAFTQLSAAIPRTMFGALITPVRPGPTLPVICLPLRFVPSLSGKPILIFFTWEPRWESLRARMVGNPGRPVTMARQIVPSMNCSGWVTRWLPPRTAAECSQLTSARANHRMSTSQTQATARASVREQTSTSMLTPTIQTARSPKLISSRAVL